MSEDMLVDDEVMQSAAETPVDYEITVAATTCKMIYLPDRVGFFLPPGKPCFRLEVPLSNADNVLAVVPYETELFTDVFIAEVAFLNEHGEKVIQGTSLWSAASQLRWYRQEQRRADLKQKYEARLEAVENRLTRLTADGQVISNSDVEVTYYKARNLTRYEVDGRHRSGELPALCAHIEKELDRLEATSPLEEFIAGLLSGKISHRYSRENEMLINSVQSLSIRTGGFIEPLTDERLELFYRERAAGVTRHVDLLTLDYKLDPDQYLPDADMLEAIEQDPEVGLAYDQVTLPCNKGEATYAVTYGLIEDGDTPVASAVITVPLVTYRKVAPEYGKKSVLPELPHGIRWYVQVDHAGKRLAKGFNDLELVKRVQKAEKGLARHKHADDPLALADHGEVPPWYRGANKPGRRR